MGTFKNKKKKSEEKELKTLNKILSLAFVKEENMKHIAECFCNVIGVTNLAEQNPLVFYNGKIQLSVTIYSSKMGEEFEKFISSHKNAASGQFAHVNGGDEDIKINLLHHIQRMKSLLIFEMKVDTTKKELDKDIEMAKEEMKNLALAFLNQMDGLFICDNAQTVYNAEGKMVFNIEGKSELPFYFPFQYQDNPKFLEKCTNSQINRRNRNMKELFDKHIYVCELPVNHGEETAKIRTKEEVVKRAFGLLLISLYSESLLNPEVGNTVEEAREFIEEVSVNYGIKNFNEVMTPQEYAYYIDDYSDEKTRISYSWRYENLYIMEWALGLVEWEFPDHICDVPKIVRNLKKFESIEDMQRQCKMRSMTEILDKADLVYRLDWAAVDARVHGLTGPADIEHGVIMEWHRALNWLICFGNEDWDHVDIPT